MTDSAGKSGKVAAAVRRASVAVWVILVMAAAFALYLGSRSASLDDFDSYSFAQALTHFDIALQQPQPPGFPVYVAAARAADGLLPGPRLALTTLSALSGALAVGMVAVIGWQLFRRRDVALGSAVLLALSPIHWLTASKALSDAPGLAMALVALAALWAALAAARTHRRWLVIGAGLLGLSLGVRPQTNLPGIALAAWLAVRLIGEALHTTGRARRAAPPRAAVRPPAVRDLALAVLVGAAAIAIWLVPVARSCGGLDEYLDLVDAHSTHVWESDSLVGQEPVSGAALRARVKDTLETFVVPTLGVSVYEPFGLADTLRIAVLVLALVGGAALADYRRVENRWLIVWFLLVFIPYFLLESLNRPRLLLPALPPLILLVVGGWMRLADHLPRRTSGLRWLVVSGAALALLLEAAPLASTLAREPAPPAQAAAYLRATYPAGETLVAAAGSFRAAQVELSGYPLVYLYRFEAEQVTAALAGGAYRYVAILDREQFSPDVIAALSGEGRYVPVDDRLFVRDARVHWQHSQVRLQVLIPADQLDAARLGLPPDGRIDLGAADDGRFVGQGWFRGEAVGGVTARWADGSTISDVRVSLEPGLAHTVTFRAAAYPQDQHVSVTVNGHVLAEFEMPADWRDYTLTLPGDLSGLPGAEPTITTLTFTHTQAESPYTRTAGSSSDQRALAAAYDWIIFVPGE